MVFTELIEPLRRLALALEADVVAPPATTMSSVALKETTLRIGAPTDVPFGSRTARIMGGRIWGDDGRAIELPVGEPRTDTELARLWSRIIGARDSRVWIAPDGRVIVEHLGRHWIIDVIGEHGAQLDMGCPLSGWVIDHCRPLLDTDGSVWDYVTGGVYFEGGSELGGRLLATWPGGGPVQITADGAVGAQTDESGEAVCIGSVTDAELDAFLS